MKFDIKEFSWVEMVSNANGKTSGTAFSGLIICMVGTICFFMGCVAKIFFTDSIDVITQSIVFTGLGTGIIGLRKYVDSSKTLEVGLNEDVEEVIPPTPIETT